MAPAKGAKRAASGKEMIPRAKKAKRTPEEEMLHRVTTVLQGAEQLPLGCREMLVAMAASSLLGTGKDERHPSQVRVVEMIGSAMDDVCAARDADVAAEAEKVKAAEEKMATLQAAGAAADAELTARAEKQSAAEAKLSEAQEAVAAAKDGFAGAEANQASAKESEVAAQAESEAFDAALREQFATLLSGSWEEEKQAQDLLESLAPFTAQLTLDESLRTALPTACLRKPDTRGSFDCLVLDQAQKAMTLRSEELRAKLTGCGPALSEATAATEAAQAHLSQVLATEEELSAALKAAKDEVASYEATCKAATQEIKAFAKELKQVVREHAATEAERSRLQAPLDAFTTLRDGPAKVVDAEPAADAATPAQLGA